MSVMTVNPKILIIDDEPEICSLLRYLLSREGFDAHVAESSLEALKLLQSSKYDGVVCDFAMPVMDGITLLKTIRSDKNFTPFIFLSGHAGNKEELEMVNLGACEVIQKPNVKLVAPALRNLLKSASELRGLEKAGEEAEEFLIMLHEAKKLA